MKKGWCVVYSIILAVFCIFLSCIAAAQEITIVGYQYPSIILIPIISIIISSVIIVFILVRLAKARRERLIRSGWKGERKPAIPFLRKEAKEVKRQENIYLKEIKKFRRDLPKLSVDDSFDKLSTITKNFFKELIGLHYEFTYDELVRELRRRRMNSELVDITERLSHMRYGGGKITKGDIENLASTIQDVVKKQSRRKEEKELGVSKVLTKEKRGIFEKLSILRMEESERVRKKHILEMMKEEEEALKKDMDIAKDIYHRILSSYYKLPPEERREVYGKLMDFYKEINRMLFSSFYGKRSKKELEYFTKKLARLKSEADKVERIAREKPSEKVREAIERLRLPELKIKPVKDVERRKHGKLLREERIREKGELKKLEEVERRAKERINRINDAVVKERMATPLKKPEKERIKITEIRPKVILRPVFIRENVHTEPSKIHPKEPSEQGKVAKPTAHEVHELRKEAKRIEVPKPSVKEVKKETKHEDEGKDKRLSMLEREERLIREKLDKLRKYIG